MPKIEIDSNSGFCFGVVTAIQKAEAELHNTGALYCLGDIVHNASEVERLKACGLETITHEDLNALHNRTVLLRAHGEPPSTYETARANNIRIIDATCPVVLQLQRRIKDSYTRHKAMLEAGEIDRMPLILIYGKEGHAEVNGLVGQTNGEAIVIQNVSDLKPLELSGHVILYSQTTKSINGFREVVDEISRIKGDDTEFEYYDTICRQVATRGTKIQQFASSHDIVIFVSGAKSSNGKALFEECRNINPRTYMVSDCKDVDFSVFKDAETIGITGATSTPRWLMSDIAELISAHYNDNEVKS